MPVTIRLRRMGRKKLPHYRVVVADSRAPRDGRFVEALGYYKPLSTPARLVLDLERVDHWLGEGAEPSATVRSLITRARRGGDQVVALGEIDVEERKVKRAEELAAKRAAEQKAVKEAVAPAETAEAEAEEPAAEAEEAPAAEAEAEAPATEAEEPAAEVESAPTAEADAEAPATDADEPASEEAPAAEAEDAADEPEDEEKSE